MMLPSSSLLLLLGMGIAAAAARAAVVAGVPGDEHLYGTWFGKDKFREVNYILTFKPDGIFFQETQPPNPS